MAGTCESGIVMSGEALAEWRSSEQVENGIVSTSPPYWDTDDDEDCGPKPSDLYGKYTWKIDKFSQINKRELRSNAFEVGNYKWYVLIYPQGCDVCNHLSLFLCVANHDKLLPGWSHFAQFTIAVVNKDPKKSKYSDTLHRFWKKEHDWGWKKFMELSKVMDGFVDADTLIIKAQVQVIRERPDRPFRCLDRLYRRELARVYLTNVEQICRRFVDEKRNNLVKLIEDKARWSGFRCFWMAIHPSSRQHMCRERKDDVLRVIVRQTFIEKEVTSTLVMDSLYSGLRALEDQSKCKIGSKKILTLQELAAPIVHVENGMFVLVDDFLKLLERAAVEPFPPKDDKGPQNRLKGGGLEDCSNNSIAREERRLTELGCKTIEIFALTNIFSKIEDAYKELVALKRQEELIREEELWLAETEQKAKHGVTEKEKKSKKKQAKKKKNNHKGKAKGKTEKSSIAVEEDLQSGSVISDDVADVSDSVSCLPELPSPGSEEKDASWDTDALETRTPTDGSSSSASGNSGVQSVQMEHKSSSIVDDGSSTCSTDSVPSVVVNDLNSGYSFPKQRNRRSVNRMKNQWEGATIYGTGNYDVAHSRQAKSGASKVIGAIRSGKAESQSKAVTLRKNEEHYMAKKESSIKGQAEEEKATSKISGPINPVSIKKPSSNFLSQADRATSVVSTADSTNTGAQKVVVEKAHPLLRPLSAPIVPVRKAPTPIASHVQTSPMLSRSASSAGWLGPDTSPSYVPLSYKNAIMGITQPQPQPQPQLQSPSQSQCPSSSHKLSISQSQPQPQFQPQPQPQLQSPSSSHKPSMSQSQPQPQFQSQPQPQSQSPSSSHKPSISQFQPQSQSPRSLHNPSISQDQPQCQSQPPSSSHKLSISQPESQNSSSSWLSLSPSHPQVSYNSSSYSRHPSQSHTQIPYSQSISFGVVDQNLLGNGSFSREIPQRENIDDFPHLDIINNLLDEEQGFTMENHQSCYENGYEQFAGNLDLLEFGDLIPQINSGMLVNEHIDGLIPNQWQVNNAGLACYNNMNEEVYRSPYHFLGYGNLTCNVMDYNAYEFYNAH